LGHLRNLEGKIMTHGGGHGHGGRGFRGGIGFAPIYVIEGCDVALDPSCILGEFGNDPEIGGIFDDLTSNAYSDNNAAIAQYFAQTNAVTPEAVKIKNDFTIWYNGLTWVGKGLQSNYDLARNQRNQFDLANATTPEEKANVQNVIQTGLSTEQLQGETDRRLDNGMLPGPVTPPTPPLIPSQYLIAGGIIGGLALVAMAYGYGKR
jgi:hypothetical protein